MIATRSSTLTSPSVLTSIETKKHSSVRGVLSSFPVTKLTPRTTSKTLMSSSALPSPVPWVGQFGTGRPHAVDASSQQSLKTVHSASQKHPPLFGVPRGKQKPSQDGGGAGGEGVSSEHAAVASSQQSLRTRHRASQKHTPSGDPLGPQRPSQLAAGGGAKSRTSGGGGIGRTSGGGGKSSTISGGGGHSPSSQQLLGTI